MKQILQTLREIGISAETIAAIESADDEKQARECALLLIAMYDDRHEFLA
jgi:SOS response regulatory protein OraA/RecX